jgi:hypothetical protein
MIRAAATRSRTRPTRPAKKTCGAPRRRRPLGLLDILHNNVGASIALATRRPTR